MYFSTAGIIDCAYNPSISVKFINHLHHIASPIMSHQMPQMFMTFQNFWKVTLNLDIVISKSEHKIDTLNLDIVISRSEHKIDTLNLDIVISKSEHKIDTLNLDIVISKSEHKIDTLNLDIVISKSEH